MNDLDLAYMRFIDASCKGERMVSNGDDLLALFEQGYLYEEFLAQV